LTCRAGKAQAVILGDSLFDGARETLRNKLSESFRLLKWVNHSSLILERLRRNRRGPGRLAARCLDIMPRRDRRAILSGMAACKRAAGEGVMVTGTAWTMEATEQG
jgi:hypothetical protein